MRQTRPILYGSLLIIAIASGIVLLNGSRAGSPDAIPFDKARWTDRELIGQEPYVRLQMIDSLLAERPLQGRSRAQVVELLGEPDKTDYFADYDLVYWLGIERGFIGIDSEWLGIKLNEQDKVVDYKILSD